MAIRAFLKLIGLNFLLKGKTCVCVANTGWRVLAENSPFSSVQNLVKEVGTIIREEKGYVYIPDFSPVTPE